MEKEKDSKWIKEKPLLLAVCWIVIFLIISIAFALCAMLNKEEFNSEGLGLFGDFFGGVIGTILTFASVIILAKTFKQQERVTNANLKQQDIQRFNDMFYELLRLYREQVESLSGEGDKEVVYKGKEFFEWYKKDMQKNIKTQIVELREEIIDQIIKKGKELKLDGKTIITKSQQEVIFELEGEELTKDTLGQKIDYMLSTNKKIPDVNDKIIDDLCMDFYVKNRDKIAPYFRILYRILDLIDTSPLLEGSEIDKQAYAKILRAQLTESELFFLRYNAQFNMYGEKLKNYLNRYNILKHLPVFELLEFQIFRDDEYKRDRKNEERVNEIFYKICKALRNRGKNHLSFDSERYKIEIRCKEEVTICCAINNNTKVVKGSDDKYFWCLFRVMKKWKNILFEYFMEEIFQASNFYEYNKNAEISVRQIECKCNNTTYIISTIKSDNPIQIGSDLQKEMKTKK